MKQRNNGEKKRRKNHAKRGCTQYLQSFKKEKKNKNKGQEIASVEIPSPKNHKKKKKKTNNKKNNKKIEDV